MSHVLVLAKSPVPGRVKTRLCPPCSPAQAADVAAAALADTLAAVAASGADRLLLALDGVAGEWLPSGFTVFQQRGEGLAERLAHAWSIAGGPGLQIGMDTPQVTGPILARSLDVLLSPGTDAVLGPAVDGGWWAIGLQRPSAATFHRLPMSTPDTCRRQRQRLHELGSTVLDLPTLRDVDTMDDAVAVASELPGSRFARAVEAVSAPASA